MAVVRVHKTKNYTVMSNWHFRETEMSLRAKGLLSLMLSLPDNWNYSVEGLVTLSKDGKDSIMACLNELKVFGYVKIERQYDAKHRITGIEYDIYEEPLPISQRQPLRKKNDESKEPHSIKPTRGNTVCGKTEYGTDYIYNNNNIYNINNNKLNTNIINSVADDNNTTKSDYEAINNDTSERSDEIDCTIGIDNDSIDALTPLNVSTADVEQHFEKLWELYPNKKGKIDVTITNKRALLKVPVAAMAKAIENYKNSMESWQSFQHGSRWFKKTYLEYLNKEIDTRTALEILKETDPMEYERTRPAT